jgi:hypothetical protein
VSEAREHKNKGRVVQPVSSYAKANLFNGQSHCAASIYFPYTIVGTDAVSLGADLLSIVVYLTPAGTVDEGGVEQPASLNIDALLLGPPAGALKGIIGEGYERLSSSNAIVEEDDFKFHSESPITHHAPARKGKVLF